MSELGRVKRLGGILRDHFAFTLNADGKIEFGLKIRCLHCNKLFAYHGSTTSLKYHLQHKHPSEGQQIGVGERKKNCDPHRDCLVTSNLQCLTNKSTSDKVCDDLTLAISRWIAISGHPTSIVEDSGLEAVLRIALQNKEYILPSRRMIETITTRMYSEKLNELKEEIKNKCMNLALTTDFGKSNNNETHCGITGHWINFDWNYKSVKLHCLNVNEGNAAVNMYKDFVRSWDIVDKVRCIVTDDPGNLVNVIGYTDCTHIPCIAHCIQLSILEGIKATGLSPLLAKCRSVVENFKCSSADTSYSEIVYSGICKKESSSFYMLQQDVPTHWYSTYLMLVRLLEVKDVIQEHDYPKIYSEEQLVESDWEKITRFVSVLSMLSEATQYIGDNEYAPCSSVLPLISFLTRKLRVQDDDPGYIARFKAATFVDLTRRVEGMDALPILQMATALDPRYKKLKCLQRELREMVWSVLYSEFEAYCNREKQVAQPIWDKKKTGLLTEPLMKKPRPTLLSSDSDSSEDETAAEDRNGLAELAHYKAENPDPESENPLAWWKMNSHRFPVLSSFVKTILCVPATSLPCERLFNLTGNVSNNSQTSPLSENATSLICLREWLR